MKMPIFLAGAGLLILMAKSTSANDQLRLQKSPFRPFENEKGSREPYYPNAYCEPLCTKEKTSDGFKKMPRREGGFGGPKLEPVLLTQPEKKEKPERYEQDAREQMKHRSAAHGRL